MLAGRVAVVTGGAAGVGKAVVQRFQREGARVVIADFARERGEELARSLEGSTYCFTDVRDEATIEKAMKTAHDKYGRIDVLVNNAVQFVFGHLGEPGTGSGTGTDRGISMEDWRRAMDTNVIGYALCTQHVLPYMKRNDLTEVKYENDQGEGVTKIDAGSRGSIVNIASISSFIAQPEFVPYNCTKGAILQLSRCTAMDFAPDKIRVNTVCPGTIETPGSYNHMKLLGMDLKEGKKVFGDSCLLKRQAAPEEIANAALFLASDESSFMTGSQIVVDGGGTI